jgi:hypothetical protein
MATSYEECLESLSSMFTDFDRWSIASSFSPHISFRETIENEFRENNFFVEETVDALLKRDKKQKKRTLGRGQISLNSSVVALQSQVRQVDETLSRQQQGQIIPYFGRATVLDSSR